MSPPHTWQASRAFGESILPSQPNACGGSTQPCQPRAAQEVTALSTWDSTYWVTTHCPLLPTLASPTHPLPAHTHPASTLHTQTQGHVLPEATRQTPGPIQEVVPSPHDEALADGPAQVLAQSVPCEGKEQEPQHGDRHPIEKLAGRDPRLPHPVCGRLQAAVG